MGESLFLFSQIIEIFLDCLDLVLCLFNSAANGVRICLFFVPKFVDFF